MQNFTLCPDKDYLKSLNIPHISFDFDDEDQLRKHLMSAMLCCPKKVDDGGDINADSVNRNIREISDGCLDLYTIGLAATKWDTVETEKIAKNPERIFQHPVFAHIVEMDESSLKFRPIPSDVLKSLYERILRGGQNVRAREGRRNAAKAEELSRPENVHRMKVACNFLMELIDRERRSQDKDCVSWQSIQKRYESMVSGVDKRDEDLMNKYKCCGLNFTEPTLNSKVVKNLTCRSSITKGLNQAVFYGIHYDNNSNVLMVGLNENTRLHSEEELKKAAEACEASASSNAAKSVYGRPIKPNHSSVVVPRCSEHSQNTSLYESAFSDVANDGQNSGRSSLERRRSNVDEALYVTTFPFGDDSSNESGSEAPRNETGVYTTDEEKDVEPATTDVRDRIQVPTLSSDLSVRALKSVAIDNSMGPRMFQRECDEDSMPVMVEPSARAPSAPKADRSCHTFAQQKSAYRTSNHRSAFGVYKAASKSEERESNWEKINHVRVRHTTGSSQLSAKVNELYEQGRNTKCQPDFVRRGSNEQYQEKQCSRELEAINSAQPSYHRSRGVCTLPSSQMGIYRTDSSPRSFRNSSFSDMRTSSCSSSYQPDQNAAFQKSALSSDERACLRMIRDFAYVYRNPSTYGFRTVENVVNLFPTSSIDYWVRLIQSHLQEVEIVTLDNMHVIIWRGSDNLA